MIKLNVIGKITEGDQIGWYVLVEPNEPSGGFYIYQFKNKDDKNGLGQAFDDWLENLVDVQEYFNESSWEIDWQ